MDIDPYLKVQHIREGSPMSADDTAPDTSERYTAAYSGKQQSNLRSGERQVRTLMTRILMLDEDVGETKDLQYFLQEQGFWVDVASPGVFNGAQESLGGYALLILDVMTGRSNGFDVLRRIRTSSTLPVLVFTALCGDADRITGLELGADDYVVKPCTPREIAARIRAILRRTSGAGAEVDVLRSGCLTMWPGQRRAEWLGKPLSLTSTEFNLLEVLLHDAGRPVSREELSKRALGRPPARYDRSIDVHLCSVRRKLGVLADGRPLIQAVYFRGYQLLKE
jgi:two-component system OmpR family response regulator